MGRAEPSRWNFWDKLASRRRTTAVRRLLGGQLAGRRVDGPAAVGQRRNGATGRTVRVEHALSGLSGSHGHEFVDECFVERDETGLGGRGALRASRRLQWRLDRQFGHPFDHFDDVDSGATFHANDTSFRLQLAIRKQDLHTCIFTTWLVSKVQTQRRMSR